MAKRTFALVATLCVGVATAVLPAPPANAANIWQLGQESSRPDWVSWSDANKVIPDTEYWAGTQNCPDTGEYSYVVVKRVGDYVYVKDECLDGRSAMARVRTTADGNTRHCRNPYGKGTWARCNFDWPENGEHWLTAGTHDGETGDFNWDSFSEKGWGPNDHGQS